MNMFKNNSFFVLLFLITSCGGGGGGGGDATSGAGGSSSGGSSSGGGSGGGTPTTPPTAQLSSNSASIPVGDSITLTWSSSNATGCDASNGWSGAKGTSGTETITLSESGTYVFALSCTNGSASVTASQNLEVYKVISGIVLDGYIRGSEVFVDTNDNKQLDTDEPSVTTDNAGAFSGLKLSQGKILAKDGIDLDTGFIFENFTLQAQSSSDLLDYIISPVTSVGSYLSNPADVNKIFGISSDIDVYAVDPIPLIDDAKYASLYSIGNKLTVLAMGVQQFEAANKDLPSYFNVIATEAQTSYGASAVSVQMDDPDFVRSVLDTALGTSAADDFKSNLSTMLSNSLYLLQVKDNSAATTGIQNFAFTTLQDDITKLKNCSSASSCVVMNNYINDVFGYVATDQNLLLSDVTIPIQAFDDVLEVNEDTELSFSQATLLANDNYLKGTGNTFVFTDVANGSFLSAEYQSFRYLPNQDFNGADTFSYTIGQAGEESTGTVTINVAPTNDNPTVIARDFLSIGGGTSVFDNVGANDIDGDALSYSIGGTDAQYISVAGNGDLSFTNAVSYASPSDSNGDNIYDFTVTVNDGSTSVTQNFQVEVKPGGSAPIFSGTTSNPSFYADNSITIQINASDPDGDAISLSISNPSGFSITSNANGFEISNSSGLAAGTYNVQGVITDNNFNTSFSFEINVLNSPSEPPRLSLNGSDVSVSSVRRRVFLYEGNRAISWGWDTANDRPVANWPTDKPYFKFDNVNLSSLIIDPQSFSIEVSYIQARNKDGIVSDYNSDESNKLFQIENFSTGDCSNLGSNGGNGDRYYIEFNAGASSCTIAFNLYYNRSASFKRITDSSEFRAQGTGTFHNRMALIEPDHNLDYGNAGSEGPTNFDFDLKLTNADKSEVYSFTAEVAALNEHPFLSPLNGDNLFDEYINTDCSANPYGSCIEYAPTLRVNTAAGERTFEFYVKDDARGSTQIAVDFVTFSNNHAEASSSSCVAVASNDANHIKCTGTIQQSVYESSSIGDTLKTVLRLTDTYPGVDTLTSYFPVYVTLR